MNCSTVGNKIAMLRKAKALTQKQLAEKINVTDKAVSKWERGLNYPDIELMEALACLFEISLLELLGLEEAPCEDLVKEISAISKDEKNKVRKELKFRSWINMILAVFLGIAQVIAGWQFHIRGIDGGIPAAATIGMLAFTGLIIGNAVYSLIHFKIL